MFWDGSSFLIKVLVLWLGRHCLVTPREGGDDGLQCKVKKQHTKRQKEAGKAIEEISWMWDWNGWTSGPAPWMLTIFWERWIRVQVSST